MTETKEEPFEIIAAVVEPIHKVDSTTHKTVVVIGKEHFLMCKQLMQDNASDDDFSKLLNIPIKTVRYFKHKMQIFEDRIRGKRRAARLNKHRNRRHRRKLKPAGSLINGTNIRKKEMTAGERFKMARDLILENYSTSEISKALRVSERSVTRFRRRLNEQKKKLQDEGKLVADEDNEEYKFKFLSPDVKAEKIAELYEQGMSATEIAKKLKISDRSVRRWRIRLDEMRKNPVVKVEKKSKEVKEVKRHHIKSLDRDVVENCKDLIKRGETNKFIAQELNLSMNTVRKIVKMILNGTVDELIDDTLEVFKKIGIAKIKPKKIKIEKSEKIVKIVKEEKVESGKDDGDDDDDFWNQNLNETKWGENDESSNDDDEYDDDLPLAALAYQSMKTVKDEDDYDPLDPLNCVTVEEMPPQAASSSSSRMPNYSQKPSANLSKRVYMGEREAITAKLLREKGVRAVDIALLMNISERSVSRLLLKAKNVENTKYDQDIVDYVDELVENREEILKEKELSKPLLRESKGYDDTKRKTGMRLLSMNVKLKDIAKMLNVSEKTIKRWQERLEAEKKLVALQTGESDSNPYALKKEPDVEIDDDYY